MEHTPPLRSLLRNSVDGGPTHTINAVLPDTHIEYIINDAGDDVLLVDPGEPFETIERLWNRFDTVREIIVMSAPLPGTDLDCVLTYEDHIVDADPLE